MLNRRLVITILIIILIFIIGFSYVSAVDYSEDCNEFYINWEHKCKQKYDCAKSNFNFCFGCKSKEVNSTLCEGYCLNNKDCEIGEFCNKKGVCEKIDYQKKLINFLNKTRRFFIQTVILSIIAVCLFKFFRVKKHVIVKKGIKYYVVIFAISFLILSYFIFPYVKKDDYSVYNHFIKYPLYISLALFLIGITVCHNKINKIILENFYFLKRKFSVGINKYVLYSAISIIFLILFWFLKTSNNFGDSNSIVWDVEHGGKFVNMGEPLTHYIYYLAYKITKNFGVDGRKTIALVNSLAGAIFVFFLLLFTDRMKNKVITLGMILTLRTMQLFFGYIENYAILSAGMMAYIYFAYLYLEKKGGIIIPTIILTITFLAHLSAGFFFLSLLYIYYQRNKSNFIIKNPRTNVLGFLSLKMGLAILSNRNFWKMILAIVAPTLIVFLYAYGYFGGNVDEYVKERPLGALQGGGDGHTIAALFERRTENEFFTMFSLVHFLEFFGEHILISPFGLFLVPLLLLFYYKKARKESFISFLIIMSSFYLIYTFIWNQDLGPYMDWDVYAPSAISYTLLAALLLRYAKEKERNYIALVVISISALHTFPWIIYNAFF